MKLCPICDHEIKSGTWCKGCKRFVKPYEISDGIHINESHSTSNDADCDYHTANQEYSRVFTRQDTSHKDTDTSSYRASATPNLARSSAYSSTVRSNTVSSPAVTPSKAAEEQQLKRVRLVIRLFVIFWILLMVFSVGGMIFTRLRTFDPDSIFSGEHEFWRENTPEGFFMDDLDPEELLKGTTAWREFCGKAGLSDLSGVKPKSYSEEDGRYIFYFPVLTLTDKASEGCDDNHFAMRLTEMDGFLPRVASEVEEISFVRDDREQVLYVNGGYTYRSFCSEVTYAVDSTYVFVNYDTVTEQLHQVDVMAEECREMGSLAYQLGGKLLQGFDLSEELFMTMLLEQDRDMTTSLEEGGNDYVTLYDDQRFLINYYILKQDGSIGRCLSIIPNYLESGE